jgi:hypothetical protein
VARRKRSPKKKITRVCAKCSAAVAAGAVLCATCVVAGPAEAAPRPLAVVKYAPITMEPEGFVPFEEMRAGWPGPAWIGRFDDHDQPEPDATFYTGGIFAGGTASTFNVAPPRIWPDGL